MARDGRRILESLAIGFSRTIFGNIRPVRGVLPYKMTHPPRDRDESPYIEGLIEFIFDSAELVWDLASDGFSILDLF